MWALLLFALFMFDGPDSATTSLILRLTPLHQQIPALLGPTYEQFYASSN